MIGDYSGIAYFALFVALNIGGLIGLIVFLSLTRLLGKGRWLLALLFLDMAAAMSSFIVVAAYLGSRGTHFYEQFDNGRVVYLDTDMPSLTHVLLISWGVAIVCAVVAHTIGWLATKKMPPRLRRRCRIDSEPAL